MKPNRAMFLSYERSLQPDLVGAGIIVPIAGLVGSRDPGPLASDQHTETAFSQEADVQRHGPLDLCRAVSIGAHNPKRSGGFEARYRYKVAPRRVQIVLALEVTTSWWPTNLTDRDTQAYPRDEHRQPVVGSCVKKTRERHAVRKMKEDPSEPSCRGRLQTAISCFGQKPRW